MLTTAQLPNDIDALKALLLAMSAEVQQLHDTASSRAHEIDRLKLLIAKLQRMLFGRRSGKLLKQVEQLQLELEELQTDEAVASSGAQAVARPPSPRDRNP